VLRKLLCEVLDELALVKALAALREANLTQPWPGKVQARDATASGFAHAAALLHLLGTLAASQKEKETTSGPRAQRGSKGKIEVGILTGSASQRVPWTKPHLELWRLIWICCCDGSQMSHEACAQDPVPYRPRGVHWCCGGRPVSSICFQLQYAQNWGPHFDRCSLSGVYLHPKRGESRGCALQRPYPQLSASSNTSRMLGACCSL
jgi:hypothetical protein